MQYTCVILFLKNKLRATIMRYAPKTTPIPFCQNIYQFYYLMNVYLWTYKNRVASIEI